MPKGMLPTKDTSQARISFSWWPGDWLVDGQCELNTDCRLLVPRRSRLFQVVPRSPWPYPENMTRGMGGGVDKTTNSSLREGLKRVEAELRTLRQRRRLINNDITRLRRLIRDLLHLGDARQRRCFSFRTVSRTPVGRSGLNT